MDVYAVGAVVGVYAAKEWYELVVLSAERGVGERLRWSGKPGEYGDAPPPPLLKP